MKYLHAKKATQTKDFKYIEWHQLIELCREPYDCEKLNTPIIGMHGAGAKTAAAVLFHDKMSLLWCDIDSGNIPIEDIKQALNEQGLESFIIYSTYKATAQAKRWRVFIELSKPVHCNRWADIERYLIDLFGGESDDCMSRVNQIAFLPNKRAEYYTYRISSGQPLNPNDTQHPFIKNIDSFKKVQPSRPIQGNSPIETFNKNNDIASLLVKYGFRQTGQGARARWTFPGSTSGIPGVKLLDGKYYSHHSNDPLHDGKCHDAFDLYVQYEHNGDVQAATRSLKQKKPSEPVPMFYEANIEPAKKPKRLIEADAGTMFFNASHVLDEYAAGQPKRTAEIKPFKSLAEYRDDNTISKVHGRSIDVKPALEFLDKPLLLDYMVDSILLRGFLYLLTGPTGTGKTAVALLLAVCVAMGRKFAGLPVKRGRVLYCAGENPIDVQMRLIALCHELKIDRNELNEWLHIKEGVHPLIKIRPVVQENKYDLVIIDTLQAYFGGSDSNSNEQMKKMGRELLRPMCELIREPTVLCLAHPVKSPTKKNNVPFGGGSLLNEVDGNLALWGGRGKPKELYSCGKFRGPDFNPVSFDLREVKNEQIKDSDGRLIPTVIAEAISDEQHDVKESKLVRELEVLLSDMIHYHGQTYRERAKRLPMGKTKIGELMQLLEADNLVYKENTSKAHKLTKKGRERAMTLASSGV